MKKLFTIFCSLLGLCSCGSDYESVDVETFAQVLSRDGVQLVDVRTPNEYAHGHISGARNIDVQSGAFDSEAKAQLDPSLPVAVYCRSGVRSRSAAASLAKQGFKVTNLTGGIKAWEAQGMPVERITLGAGQ